MESIADDAEKGFRTRPTADFDWPDFDRNEDLGNVEVPYRLYKVDEDAPTGTTLVITRLRREIERLDLNAVRTGTIGILTPLRSLFRKMADGQDVVSDGIYSDPGFILSVKSSAKEPESGDAASQILDAYALRATLAVDEDLLDLRVFQRGTEAPCLSIVDKYENEIRSLHADMRFFPRRTGTFTNMPVDGRRAQGWITENHGVAVFDRGFRVPPYGYSRDDWLQLQTDAARNRRDPRSSLSKKHFAMSPDVRAAPALNWMLRLPRSLQLVGLVQVEGSRTQGVNASGTEKGLVASADREGFVENRAFAQLQDLVRGAVEAIAHVDRKLQVDEEEAHRARLAATLRDQTRTAIAEVQANPEITASHKARIVPVLSQTGHIAELERRASREREQQLEIMSLLGVAAGFTAHEFGAALQESEKTRADLPEVAEKMPRYQHAANRLSERIRKLKDFVTYSTGYIHGARSAPDGPYAAKPRLAQVKRVFGKYAQERSIKIEITAERDLPAPFAPASLYNGIALNLYTNALKAVTAKAGEHSGLIAFRAWNDSRRHYLEASDTGIGIPSVLHDRVFDPLLTTTTSRNDPSGSGMGLGLTLVRRGAEAFGGSAELVNPPGGFSTCIRVCLPLPGKDDRK